MITRVDLRRAAEIYIDSAEAAHGDIEQAEWEAAVWLSIFRQVEAETLAGDDEYRRSQDG